LAEQAKTTITTNMNTLVWDIINTKSILPSWWNIFKNIYIYIFPLCYYVIFHSELRVYLRLMRG
jgi:hypothetical protein